MWEGSQGGGGTSVTFPCGVTRDDDIPCLWGGVPPPWPEENDDDMGEGTPPIMLQHLGRGLGGVPPLPLFLYLYNILCIIYMIYNTQCIIIHYDTLVV